MILFDAILTNAIIMLLLILETLTEMAYSPLWYRVIADKLYSLYKMITKITEKIWG
jgi:hypothetical protein